MTTALREQSYVDAAASTLAPPGTGRLSVARRLPRPDDPGDDPGQQPGAWGEKSQYWPLDHAEWHGWTPTDLIFPFFLFIVGTSMAYSLRKYRHGTEISPAVYWRIIRRTALLIFLGWMPTLLLKTIAHFQRRNVRPEQPPHLRRARAHRDRLLLHVAHRAPRSRARPSRTRDRHPARLLGHAGLVLPTITTTGRICPAKETSSVVVDRALIGPTSTCITATRLPTPKGC